MKIAEQLYIFRATLCSKMGKFCESWPIRM